MGSVTIDHNKLDSAITKVSTLSSAVDRHRNNVLFKSPVDHPELSALSSVPTWLDGEKPMLQGLRDIAYLLATESNPVVTFDVGSSLHDVEELLGKTLADKARSTSPYDEEGAERFVEILGRWSSDPQVMSEMFGTLGPEETLAVTSTWATEIDNHVSTDPTEQQRNVLRFLKNGLQSATQDGGWSDYESGQFAEGLVEAATGDPEDTMRDRINYNPAGALTYLLYDGRFSDAFVETMADELDEYERQDNEGASGLWGSRPENGVDFGLYMDWGTDVGGLGNLDPMTGLMSAMSHNPKVALDFFSDEDGDPPRSQYYIKERNWNGDNYNGVLAALDAATTDDDILDGSEDDQHRAATLASATVEYLSERGNADDLPEILSRFPEQGAAEDLSHILGTYMNGVVPGLDNTDSGIDAYGNRPAFDRESLEKVSLMAMSTDRGLAELTNGMNNYRALHLGMLADNLAENDTADNRTLLRDGIQMDARLQGFFLNTLGDDEIRDADARDAATRAMVNHLTDVVDIVPVPGVSKLTGVTADIANMTIDTVKGEAYESFADSLAHEGSDTRSEFNDTASEVSIREQFTMAQFLDERGLSAHPDRLPELVYPNGRAITYEEYSNLGSAEQDEVERLLFGADGVGGVYNRQDYSEAFESEFHEYFD